MAHLMPMDETITIARSKLLGEKPQDVPIPRSLGSVRLLDEIGRGGSGTVYRGRDEVLSRTVAVKFVSGGSGRRGTLRDYAICRRPDRRPVGAA
jgi:hypothetical protein